MVMRIIATLVAFGAYWLSNALYGPQATLLSGTVAGNQFKGSDTAYTNTVYMFSLLNGISTLLMFTFFGTLILIWRKPVMDVFKKAFPVAAVAVLAGATTLASVPNNAHAFFSTTDRTEVVPILPNQSAFWIPDAGDNKNTQAKFGSEDYLNKNKVAFKRFIIPHQKLQGSAGKSMLSGWDYFVPTGRLIVVDRTPYSREWVDATDRGTSTKRQGFPCQSNEGLNIKVGISIGTSVSENNAAKFLFRFGVKPPKGELTGNPKNDGPLIFTSVYQGRSLQEVMDDVGRKKVQTLVCNEIGKRNFDQANKESQLIIADTEKAVKKYFASVGITLDFIGWGDSYEFDPSVQKVVNDRYAAHTLKPLIPVLQEITKLQIQEGLGKGFAAHGAPIVVTPGMIEALSNMVKSTTGGGAVLSGK